MTWSRASLPYPHPLLDLVYHHVPDVVFGDVPVVDDHHVADHPPVGINPEWLALVTVDIRLSEAAYGMGGPLLLPRRERKVERIDEVALVYGLELDQWIPP